MKFTAIQTLADLAIFISENKNNNKFTNYLRNGSWLANSTKDFSSKVFSLSENLILHGLKKGDKIALFCDSSPNWLICDFACQMIGVVTVPIFTNISKENLAYQLKHSEVKYAFIIGSDKWKAVKPYVGSLKKIFIHELRIKEKNSVNLNDLFKPVNGNFSKIINNAKKIKPDDLATIIYTSGSTAMPKGVCLTHKNLVSQIKDSDKSFPVNSDDVILSYLPLAHIFERMVMYFYLSKNSEIYFVDDIENIANLMQEIKPTMMTTVPRLLEKIYNKIEAKQTSLPVSKKIIASFAIYYAKKTPEWWYKNCFVRKLFAKLIYSKILAILGGRIKMMICGGAPLDTKLALFYKNIGLNLLEGYGLTEASPVIAANNLQNNKFASVGKLFPSVKVKIAANQEILVKGPNVMQGYYRDVKNTKEAIKDGWLYTGDMGRIDESGYLYVTGRIKELQKTSNGKYVATTRLESALKELVYIDEVVIIADRRKFVSAIIFPDFNYIKENKIKLKDLKLDIQEEILKINRNFNHWEEIQKFIIAKISPSIENAQLTPSMKIRRHKILEDYEKVINELY
ncbi:MAG: long-chain fatty acid--CoA ligase [Rickettsiales bacterium]|nr:long-chain fatty acid--CoA ligase [Rickettsiales bacterium]